MQPKLTLKDAKRIVRGTVGSAVARAQEKYGTRVMALVVMSNHLQMGNLNQDDGSRLGDSG